MGTSGSGRANKISNFPGGFAQGVTIRGVSVTNQHGGNVYWVNSSASGASNGNKGTFDRPWSTVAYAFSSDKVTAGDIVYVGPGHTEAITTNDQVNMDIAGVTVICMGTGDVRPTFTWSGTDATACMTMAAADLAWYGGVFVSSDAGDDITGMMRIEADDCELAAAEFREGTGQPESAVLVSAGLNRVHIHHCKFTSLTNGAAANDAAIEFSSATAQSGLYIHDNYIHGTYDQAGIWCADTTAAFVDVRIVDNIIINTASSLYAIDLGSSTPGTGVIAGNFVSTDAEATSIRRNGANLIRNNWSSGALESAQPGAAMGAQLCSVAPAMSITSTTADEIAVVSAGGPIIINSIVGVCTTLHEAEAAAVFDNIVTGSSGNLYAADQETALQDSAFEVGDYVVFEQAGPTVVEAATSQTEDSRGLNWLVQASDTIDIEGGSAEAEGAALLIINYTSLGGELEVEAV